MTHAQKMNNIVIDDTLRKVDEALDEIKEQERIKLKQELADQHEDFVESNLKKIEESEELGGTGE